MNEDRSDTRGKARLAERLSPVPLGFDGHDGLGIRLRRADIARLFGISRARVTQLCQEGRIPVLPSGLIDPSAAAHALLMNSDPKGLQLRILAPLRERIAEAEVAATGAIAARDRAVAAAAELRALVGILSRRWLEAERWLETFQEELLGRAEGGEPLEADDIEQAFEAAGVAVLDRPLAELAIAADPEALELVAAHLPELGAPPCHA